MCHESANSRTSSTPPSPWSPLRDRDRPHRAHHLRSSRPSAPSPEARCVSPPRRHLTRFGIPPSVARRPGERGRAAMSSGCSIVGTCDPPLEGDQTMTTDLSTDSPSAQEEIRQLHDAWFEASHPVPARCVGRTSARSAQRSLRVRRPRAGRDRCDGAVRRLPRHRRGARPLRHDRRARWPVRGVRDLAGVASPRADRTWRNGEDIARCRWPVVAVPIHVRPRRPGAVRRAAWPRSEG